MASRSLGTLTLDLVAKIGAFVQGMNQAERASDRALRNIERRAQAFGKFLGATLGVSIAGAFAGTVAAINKSIDRMDALRDASIRLGIGVETLSAFDYAAQQTGTSIDDLGKSFKILAKNMADAGKEGSAKSNLFESIGVQVADAQGNLRKFEDVIPEIADAFAQLEDGAQKAALAQELFGKSGLEMIEFLNQGGAGIRELTDRARELGVTFDQEAADKADEFNDRMADLKAGVLGVSQSVAIELLPDLIKLVSATADLIEEFGGAKAIAGEVRSVFSGLAETASFLWNVFDTGAMTLKGVAYDLAAVYKLLEAGNSARMFDFAGAKQSFEEAKRLSDTAADASRQIGKNWTEFERNFGETGKAAKAAAEAFKVAIPGVSGNAGDWRIPGLTDSFSAVPVEIKPVVDQKALQDALAGVTDKGGGGKGGGKSAASRAMDDAQRAAQQAREEVDRLNASYAEQIALFGDTSEAAKLRYQFEQEDISKLDAATQAYIQTQRAEAIARAEKIDVMREEKDVQDELDRANQQRADAVQSVLEDIQHQKDLLGATAEEADTYNKLLYAGVEANSVFGQAIVQANHELHEQAKAVSLQIDAMDLVRDGVKDVTSDIIDAAREGTLSWDTLKDSIDDVAAALTKMILNNLWERALGESGSTSGGSGGGWLSTALGWLFGAGSSGGGGSGSFVGPRAIGGGVYAGGMYQVAEHEPELLSFGGRRYLMMGNQNGQVSRIDRSTHNRGGNTVIVNQNFPGMPNRKTLEQGAREAGKAASRGVSRTG